MALQKIKLAVLCILCIPVVYAVANGIGGNGGWPGAPVARIMARDPGVRAGPAGAGGPIPGLNSFELAFFTRGQEIFMEVDSVSGTVPGTGLGLGPRFNMDQCAGCHAYPAVGGSSPYLNPQIAVATKYGAMNVIPFFITPSGPVREPRFIRLPDGTLDGSVHGAFTIAGRYDAPGCDITQFDFNAAQASHNLSLRIPSPTFGAGLIENIADQMIIDNKNANLALKNRYGISGHENRSPNDQTVTRFGWKAQNKTLLIFAGEAYTVEQGVSNELFNQERDTTINCVYNATPEDRTHLEAPDPLNLPSDVVNFATFSRFLAPPTPAPDTRSSLAGRALFNSVGCALCHTPQFTTGKISFPALSEQTAHLYSDILVHHMGTGLADGIIQGNAGIDEFRTAPLWGIGQRIFFLHDGRTNDLLVAIRAHRSPGSEASIVINNFNRLTEPQKQSILDFLRSL